MGAIAFTMVVGALLVLCGLALINGMEQNWLTTIAGTMVGDVSVTAGTDGDRTTFPTGGLLRAADRPEVAYATERIEFDGMISKGEATAPATVRGIAAAREERLRQTLESTAGQLLALTAAPSGGRTAVALSRQMAANLGAAAGDEVTLSGTRLDGVVFQEKATVLTVFDGSVKNAALDLWVLTPLEDAARMLGAASGQATSVRVFLKKATDAGQEQVVQALEAVDSASSLTVRTWQQTEESSWMTSVRVWRGVLLFFVAVLALLIMMGASGVIWATVLERTREVGTMRALGMTPLQVFFTLMVEMLLVGLFSSAAAAGLGYLLLLASRGGLPATTESLALTFGAKRLYPMLSGSVLALGMLFTTVLGIVSGVLPALRVSLMKEIEALRHV